MSKPDARHDQQIEKRLWERLQAGHHTAAVGLNPKHPPHPLNLVRISCDAPASTLGPLFEAQRQIEALLGNPTQLFGYARQRVLTGLRRRLLGDLPGPDADRNLVDVANRLVQQSSQPYILVFDALETADISTLADLTRLVQRPGAMRMPLLLVMRQRSWLGGAGALLEALRESEGEDAVVAPQAAAPSGEGTEVAAKPVTVEWRRLPTEIVQVLRAGALIGPGFEAALVAALLHRHPLDVYDSLQRAFDAGVPLEDRGDGRFFLDDVVMGDLRASILPSLAAAWHHMLGQILAEDDIAADLQMPARSESEPVPTTASPASANPGAQEAAVNSAASAVPSPVVAAGAELDGSADSDLLAAGVEFARHFDAQEAAPTTADPTDVASAQATDASPMPPADAAVQVPDLGADHSGAMVVESLPIPEDVRARASADEMVSTPISGVRPNLRSPQRDPARAASHLSAAGDLEAAAERYMIAAGQAAAAGAFGQAMDHVQRALLLTERLPMSPGRRAFRIRTMITLGRLQWQAVDTNHDRDAAFTLASALATADTVLRALGEDDDPVLIAEARSLAANICYDLGDSVSLERALNELTEASTLLLDAGDAVGAARLLNDQAAVYVRLGDPVRATHLLGQSQRVFEKRAESDPVTMIELAETHHLLARLPLQARIRPGHEADAIAMGLDHAKQAERWYRRLQSTRELARVWESMGRLELARKQADAASEHLARALQVQSRIGDVTGLARTTDAMSAVLALRGLHRNALMMLGDSITLNLDKGSPIGLAYNRRAYDVLRQNMLKTTSPDGEGIDALTEVGQRLDAAEAVLGRVALPADEPDE